MNKLRIEIEFSYTLTQQVVRSTETGPRVITEHVGDLTVKGFGYRHGSEGGWQYSADIDFIFWNGTDIKPVLEALRQIEDIYEAACSNTCYEFSNQKMTA